MLLGLRRSSPLAFCAKLTARREKAKLACHMTELEHISHNNVSGGSSGTNQHHLVLYLWVRALHDLKLLSRHGHLNLI